LAGLGSERGSATQVGLDVLKKLIVLKQSVQFGQLWLAATAPSLLQPA
jgi:hypothetical protein